MYSWENQEWGYFLLLLLLLEWSIYFLGAEEDEKGLADQANELVAGFDEEKEKLLELQGNECFISNLQIPGLVPF